MHKYRRLNIQVKYTTELVSVYVCWRVRVCVCVCVRREREEVTCAYYFV